MRAAAVDAARVATLVAALLSCAGMMARAAPRTLIGEFTAGMRLEEIDTIAARQRFRWLARGVRYDADSTLRLYEVRDTSVRGTLIYGLTLDASGLRQVELYRSDPPELAADFGRWLSGVLRGLSSANGRPELVGDAYRWCRPSDLDGAIVTTMTIQTASRVSIVATAGTLRAGCVRC